MVNYTCYRCGYETHIKTILIRHLSRKNICGLKLYDINILDFKQFIENGNKCDEYLESIKNTQKILKNGYQNTHKILKTTQKNHILPHKYSQDDCKDDCEDDINQCEYCKKVLSSYKNLWRHLKTCKKKKEEDDAKQSMKDLVNLLNEKNKELNKQLEKRDKQIDELIKKAGINNSTITNNIQNNIKLLAYDNTDISNITDKDIMKCMNHSNMCVPYLIKMIHLDPEKPENHNVYISNLKNGYIMVYDGDKWDTLNREELIDNIISDKQGLIEERVENWIEKGKKYPTIMKKFERYLEKKEINIVINKIKEEIKFMLYNNKSLIKNKCNSVVD